MESPYRLLTQTSKVAQFISGINTGLPMVIIIYSYIYRNTRKVLYVYI